MSFYLVLKDSIIKSNFKNYNETKIFNAIAFDFRNDSSCEKGKENNAILNGIQNNNEPQIMKIPEKPPIVVNRICETDENVPKSSSSRFSVQSVGENGSSNRLPIITEDVSFA